MNRLRLLSIFFFIYAFFIQSTAQEWVSHQSQQKINDLVETSNDLLLATDNGLVVINKLTFEKTIFTKSNSNLPFNHIQTITQTPNGDTWIGTYDLRLAQFDGSDFTNITVPEGIFNPNTIKLYDLKFAPNGDLWAGTSQGIFRKENQNWLQYGTEELGNDLGAVWDIEIEENGDVFIASNKIYKFSNDVWTNFSDQTQLLAYLDADLFFTSNDEIISIGDLDRIGRFDGNQWTEYEISDFDSSLSGSNILGITEDTNGLIYINTRNNGIFKLENDIWSPHNTPQTEAYNNNTSYFYIDNQNQQWLNNNIHLSLNNNNGTITTTTISNQTIEFDNVYTAHKGSNGAMFFVTSSTDHISVREANGEWSFLPLPDNFPVFEIINDILWLSTDNIWLCTSAGLRHYNGIDWELINMEYCISFALDPHGIIYVRTTERIFIMDNDDFSEYNTFNSPIGGTITGHGVDDNGILWIAEGFENKIHRITTDGNWNTFSIPDNPSYDSPNGDFHFDVNGNIWIPADIVGAIRYDGTEWSNPFFGQLDQVENYRVKDIQSDINGKLYFANESGVTTWLNEEWEDLRIDDVPTGTSSISKIQFDNDGTLWWANNRFGVFSYTPTLPTSINANILKEIQFKIYPNPTHNYSTLDFEIKESSNVIMNVLNQLGQKIYSDNLGNFPRGQFKQRIDVSSLPKGIYLIQLNINDHNSNIKKIIKM